MGIPPLQIGARYVAMIRLLFVYHLNRKTPGGAEM
jgi:hypothetical protein